MDMVAPNTECVWCRITLIFVLRTKPSFWHFAKMKAPLSYIPFLFILRLVALPFIPMIIMGPSHGNHMVRISSI